MDTFGLAAGYPAKEEDSFEYHGTEDWRGLGDAKNARKLKRSKAKDKIDTWQNAESFAAMATGKKILLSFVLILLLLAQPPSVLFAFFDLNGFDPFPDVQLAVYQNKNLNL